MSEPPPEALESISLVGMPAAGKSTVGVLLAKRLGRPFVDTDVCIQAATGRTLRQIIAADGMEAFRRIEREHVTALELNGHVVATGGSVIYSDEAMEHLSASGSVVYLQTPLEVLAARLDDLEGRGVVIGPGMTLAELYAERRGLYERWADVTVECAGMKHHELVDAVVAVLFPSCA